MITSALREKIIDFTESQITLDQLEEWFVPRSLEFFRQPESEDAIIAGAIELCLAESSEQIKSLDECRDYLRQALSEHSVFVEYPGNSGQRTETGASGHLPRSVTN
jgi:uncharacterized membrane protein